MEIGILTYHWVSNFGANLQALSTYKYIENSGHNPIIINWIPEDLENSYDRMVLTCQNEIHKQFAKENFINITDICRNGEEIAREIEKNGISRVLIGSDAVFTNLPKLARYRLCRRGFICIKPNSDSDFPNPFWGNFIPYLKNKIEIFAISASAQNMQYKKVIFKKERNGYSDALKEFTHITVRDIWTQDMIKYMTHGEIVPNITPDPVFAFEQNVRLQSRNYVHNRLGIDGQYVLFSAWDSIKDKSWIIELEKLFEEKGIYVIGLPKTTMKKLDSPLKYNLDFPISPLDWYDSIKYSCGYIGELMHPVLVSLHNSVPIFSFDTYGFCEWGKLNVKSSKIYQILKRFNLLENYYNKKYSRKLPSPEFVVKKINLFDKKSCSNMSMIMWNEYNEMMKKSIL